MSPGYTQTGSMVKSTSIEFPCDTCNAIACNVEIAINGFITAMDDDLNVPEAIKHLFDFVRELNKLLDENSIGKNAANQALTILKKINSIIGVMNFEEKFFELTSQQEKLVKERSNARSKKNWAKADEIRDKLKKQGIIIVDNKDGTTTTKSI